MSRRLTREERNFRTTLELSEAGIAMKRMQFRRDFPDDTAEQINERMRRWLTDRPMDGDGIVRPWPRTT